MIAIGAYIVFLLLTWTVIIIQLRNAPTDLELWGEETE